MTNETRIHEIRTSDSIAVVFHSPFGLWYSFGIPHSGFVITEQSAGWTAKQRGRFLSSGFSLSSHQGRRGPGRGGLFALLGNPLSPTLSPFVPHGEREDRSLSAAMRSAVEPQTNRPRPPSRPRLPHFRLGERGRRRGREIRASWDDLDRYWVGFFRHSITRSLRRQFCLLPLG